jgi:hypothetical protein
MQKRLDQRDGTLQDLFKMTERTLPPKGEDLPDGTAFVPLKDIPLPYSKVRVESSKIIKEPSHINPRYQKNYDRYMMFVPENGVPFYLLIQKGVSDARIIRSKEILEFFLTDVPGSQYGHDKTEVANKMGENGAVLLLLTGAHRDPNNLPGNQLPGQELYESETPVPGDEWYMTQVREHRDAGFEEILHLVQDNGIGATSEGALEEFESKIASTVEKNAQKGLLILREGFDSNSQEYFAGIVDCYYGLLDAVGRERSFGRYTLITREKVKEQDPLGYEILNKFLPPYISVPFSLDPQFSGTFKMVLSTERYTRRSQYLLHLRITGTNDVNVEGNDLDNIIIENPGDNRIDGAQGIDVVYYAKPFKGFTITPTDETIEVKGSGTDTLSNIEYIVFKDAVVKKIAPSDIEIKYDVPEEIDSDYEVLDNIDISKSPNGVVPLPKGVGKTLNVLFSKYTKHVAPNGKPIHIFVQSDVPDLKVVRAREILKYHLTDVPGTQYGNDKSAIANRMAEERASLLYANSQALEAAMRPTVLPDGKYKAEMFTIQPYSHQ